MKDIRIVGSGYAVAKHCVTNNDLSKIVETNDEWITTRTGIKTRYVSSVENTSDLGYRAAKEAIENANMDVKEIDLIIVATMTPDHFTPSCACLIQEKLGLNECHVMAFDINAACSGFIYALHVASSMLQNYKCALVIGAETLSKLVDFKDRNTCVLFGDGAGAFVLRKEKTSKELHFFAQAKGDNKGILMARGIPMKEPLVNSEKTYGYLKMDGKEVFRFAIKAMEEAIIKVLEEANKTLDDIDLIIPHQANLRIIKHVAKKMKLSEDTFYVNVNEFGNTSAASVAIAYAQAVKKGVIKEGMKVLFVGFGAGFTYASCYVEV